MAGKKPGWHLNPGLADPKAHTLYSTMHAVPTALWGQGTPRHFYPRSIHSLSCHQVCWVAGGLLRRPSAIHSPQAHWRAGQPDCPDWLEHWGSECWVWVPGSWAQHRQDDALTRAGPILRITIC